MHLGDLMDLKRGGPVLAVSAVQCVAVRGSRKPLQIIMMVKTTSCEIVRCLYMVPGYSYEPYSLGPCPWEE